MGVARQLPILEDGTAYDPRKLGAACHMCPCRGTPIVPPKSAYLAPKLVFVGEGPGRKEQIRQVPFVGMTGQYLRSLCREVDIDFREAYLTNAALCRSESDKENEEAAVCCAPRLLKELAELPADIPIVALGKAAALTVLGTKSIMHARGFVWTARKVDPSNAIREAKKAKLKGAPKWREMALKAQIAIGRSKLAGRTVFPTVHPAFVLRSDTWGPIIKIDLDRVARWLKGTLKPKHLRDLERFTLVTSRPNEVRAGLRQRCGTRATIVQANKTSIRQELGKLGPVISIDIETIPSKPGGPDGANPLRNKITCVGMSDGEFTVVLWPWLPQYAKHIIWLYKRAEKIGMHNGYCFDQIALARHGVPFEPFDDKLEDTLIAHHTFASHMPQRLAHVASVFVDAPPWKITFKRGGGEEKGLPPEKLSPEELVLYNGMDAVIQARVWLAMQADLASELDVYETDKDNGRLCRGMGIAGIGVDLDRRAELLDLIQTKVVALEADMRLLLKRPNFHPMQLSEVRRALFTTLRAPMTAADPTDSGLPSTSSKTLERLKGSPTRAGRFADMLLQWRGAVKIKSTYILSQVLDKPPRLRKIKLTNIRPIRVSRTHFNWRSYGAASGRYACRLQSCPRQENVDEEEQRAAKQLGLSKDDRKAAGKLCEKEGHVFEPVRGFSVCQRCARVCVTETRTRELYIAKPGHKLVYFDLSQAELRMAAYLSNDTNYIRMCESGDVHTAIAQILFPSHAELIRTDPKGAGKPFRDVEKNSIFGFQYFADPTTIFGFCQNKGFSDVHMSDVLGMQGLVRNECAVYFSWVEQNKRFCDKHGHYRCPISGRISWLGWHTGYPDVSNRPIQCGIAAIMNVRLPRIQRALPRGASVVAQIHDAAISEVPDRYVDDVKTMIKKTWEEPVIIPADGYGSSLRVEDGARHFIMPIDLKAAQRWSDFG